MSTISQSGPGRPRTFHVLTPAAQLGDAVGNDVLGMRDALRAVGFSANAYAEYIAPELTGEVLPLAEYERDGQQVPRDVLIYHHCTMWHRGEEVYRNTCNARILRYHNVTPSSFFSPYSDECADLAVQSRDQTMRLVQLGADLFLGASRFNLQELADAGANPAKSDVVFPFHHADQLSRVDTSLADLEPYQDGRINILFVGRFSPNKGHLSLLRTFAFFHSYIQPQSRLILVGKSDSNFCAYNDQFRAATSQLGLEKSVTIVSAASQRQLAAAYRAAKIFLCLSEHEGFCVPLIEAMLYKVPIIALARTAVGETLGPESLTYPELDEIVFAEMMNYCLERSDVRAWLTESQYRRYRENFSHQVIAERFLEIIRKI